MLYILYKTAYTGYQVSGMNTLQWLLDQIQHVGYYCTTTTTIITTTITSFTTTTLLVGFRESISMR